MKLISYFTIKITVEDCIGFFDAEGNLLNLLKNLYEGKILKQHYIHEILSVERKSECEISRKDLSCSGNINIEFKAITITRSVGEIIKNCYVGNNPSILLSEFELIYNKNPQSYGFIPQKSPIHIYPTTISYVNDRNKIGISGCILAGIFMNDPCYVKVEDKDEVDNNHFSPIDSVKVNKNVAELLTFYYKYSLKDLNVPINGEKISVDDIKKNIKGKTIILFPCWGYIILSHQNIECGLVTLEHALSIIHKGLIDFYDTSHDYEEMVINKDYKKFLEFITANKSNFRIKWK